MTVPYFSFGFTSLRAECCQGFSFSGVEEVVTDDDVVLDTLVV